MEKIQGQAELFGSTARLEWTPGNEKIVSPDGKHNIVLCDECFTAAWHPINVIAWLCDDCAAGIKDREFSSVEAKTLFSSIAAEKLAATLKAFEPKEVVDVQEEPVCIHGIMWQEACHAGDCYREMEGERQ